MANRKSILLYGRTRAGKTTQIGAFAEWGFSTTGKVTRIYTCDRGGVDSIQPYIDLGIVEVVAIDNTSPWIFLNKATQGMVRNDKGEWVVDKERNANVFCYVFESMTAFADAMMNDLALQAANNVNIGGGANINFDVTDGKEKLKISGNNMSHYNVVQMRITDEVWRSQKLDANYVLWTASVSKDDDATSSNKVLGPEVIGKKLTAEVPRWFQYTFRIDCTPSSVMPPKEESHILYLGNSLDQSAGNAISLGNTRVPLDGTKLPPKIEPADLAKAVQMIEGANGDALQKIKARLATAGKKVG